MDRSISITQPIALVVTPQALRTLRDLASGDPQEYLRRQLSNDLYCYAVGERAYLVTRSLFAVATLRSGPAGAALSVESVARASSQEYNRASREGCRVRSSWTIGGTGRGAQEFWQSLKKGSGDSSGGPGGFTANDPGGSTGAILPQDQIDLLIATLQRETPGRSAPPRETAGWQPMAEESRADLAQDRMILPGERPLPGSMDPVPGPAIASDTPSGDIVGGGMTTPATVSGPPPTAAIHGETAVAREIPASAGVTQDYWLQLGQQSVSHEPGPAADYAPAPIETASRPSAPEASTREVLAGFLEGHPYAMLIVDREDQLAEELAFLSGQPLNRTILAFWAGVAKEVRVGPQMAARLAMLRQQYRAAAADLETALGRLRQHEQVLPNLEKCRAQETELAVELDRVHADLRQLQLNHVLASHDGRELARRVYALEARRRRLRDGLSRATYGLLRRSKPGPLVRRRLERARTEFMRGQQELEGCLDRLSLLERESQRRLEYQADWQTLMKRQLQLQHEQEEIGRFLKATALSTPAAMGDAREVERWLQRERERLRCREKFQLSWLAYLDEEKAWALRRQEEPVVILGDASLLDQPRMACGAHLIIRAAQGGIPGRIPDDCASWVVVNSSGKIVGSGNGIGAVPDYLPALLAEVAAEAGLAVEEAKQILGWTEDTPPAHAILG